jgi:hypothetical protein
MKAAQPRGIGARGGNGTLRIVGILDSIAPAKRPQAHTPSHLERVLEAGIAEIEEARAARARAVTDHERWYFGRVAEDVANHLADNVLRCRRQGSPRPSGVRALSPRLGFLRGMLDLQRQITAARSEVRYHDMLVRAAWSMPDGSPSWCAWERHMSKLWDAERELAALERKAAPWN